MNLTTQFSTDDIETLLRTAAELWASHPDHSDLSTRQSTLAERAHHHFMHEWEPEPSLPDQAAFVIDFHDPVPYVLDDDAFNRWITAKGEKLEDDIPNINNDDSPSATLARLVHDAIDHGVLTGPPLIELQINEDDDTYSTGYYIILHNRHGNQRFIGLTTGWTEIAVDWWDEDLSPADDARRHLQNICDTANRTLHRINPQPISNPRPRPSQETNTE